MWERAFIEQSLRPTAETLVTHLGAASGFLDRVEALTSGYTREWRYAKGTGWTLKIFDRRKALLYLIPLCGAVAVSLAVRDHEHEVLLADPELAAVRDTVAGARRVSEGYAMRFTVSTEEEYLPVARLLTTVMALRA